MSTMRIDVDNLQFSAKFEELGVQDSSFAPAPVVSDEKIIHAPARAPIYYRSKIFVSDVALNALITAAAPLFSTIEKLKKLTESPDLSRLHHDLMHEIYAFTTRAQLDNYPSHVVMAARYALCCWADEILLHSHWSQYSSWEKHTLVSALPHEGIEGRTFFWLLDRCSQDPKPYLDLLELMYLCLSLGFEGEYRYAEDGHRALTQRMDTLYQLIQTCRGEISKKLEIIVPNKPIVRYGFAHYRRIGLLATGCVIVMIGAWTMWQHELNARVESVSDNIELLASPPLSSQGDLL